MVDEAAPDPATDSTDAMFRRMRELKAEGLDHSQALGLASLEQRVRAWPPEYGEDLVIVIGGDFTPPEADLHFPALGITVEHKKLEKSVMRTLCALRARVRVSTKTVAGVQDAVRRINILLGAWTLVDWGNRALYWWSYVTHGTRSAVGGPAFKEPTDVARAADGIVHLTEPIRTRVEAALYWIREPRSSLLEARPDTLRIYSAWWSAFECLVYAVLELRPPKKLTKSEKKAEVARVQEACVGPLEPKHIQDLYTRVIGPSFRREASSALRACLGDDADHYIHECFGVMPKEQRLYDVRNAIAHGSIKAEDVREMVRIESRSHVLWQMLWSMFGRIVPFAAPVSRPPKPT